MSAAADTLWTLDEINFAQREQHRLRIVAPGLSGKITSVRATDVEFALSFPGKAFVGIASILDRPPTRFPDGTRVATPYGAGVVAALRSSPERIDYLVHFVDKKLANGKPVVGYLRPADVKPRTALMFDEAVADATAAREDGNRLFKSRDFWSAVTSYKRAVEVLSELGPNPLDLTQREALRECVVKALSNAAQAHLSLATSCGNAAVASLSSPAAPTPAGSEGGDAAPAAMAVASSPSASPSSPSRSLAVESGFGSSPSRARDYSVSATTPSSSSSARPAEFPAISAPGEGVSPPQPALDKEDASKHFILAIRNCTDGLEIDPSNTHGQRDKLLYRRGVALMGVGELEAALKDLSVPSDALSRSKAAEVKAGLKRAREKEKRMWGAAFSKSAAAAASGEEVSDSASSPVSTPAAKVAPSSSSSSSIRGASSAAAAPSSTADEPDGWNKSSSNGSSGAPKRSAASTAAAGRTPHPRGALKQSSASSSVSPLGGTDFTDSSATATATLEMEATEEAGSLMDYVPYVAVAGAVALGGLALFAYARSRR